MCTPSVLAEQQEHSCLSQVENMVQEQILGFCADKFMQYTRTGGHVFCRACLPRPAVSRRAATPRTSGRNVVQMSHSGDC